MCIGCSKPEHETILMQPLPACWVVAGGILTNEVLLFRAGPCSARRFTRTSSRTMSDVRRPEEERESQNLRLYK